ncbi:MAG: hypothetical protein DBX41_05905, partial [Clostridiales bacterium]
MEKQMKTKLASLNDSEKFINEIKRYLKHYKMDAEQSMDIVLCLREGINNAFLHGKSKISPQVEVSWEINDNIFSFLITDGGNDMPKIPEGVVDALSEHGRGLYLMQAILDEMYLEKGAVGGKLAIRA